MTTPYMGLTLPTVSVTAGPTYATELNSAFDVVDAHNHTAGKGLAVPTAGINLNADLPHNGYNATTLRSTRFTSQGSPLALASDLSCVYVSSGNLYYNNSSGAQIQLTAGSGINLSGTTGIGGDYAASGASCFYTLASTLYSFTNSSGTFSDIKGLNLIISNAGLYTATLSVSGSTTSNVTYTLPVSLPGSTLPVSLASTGALSAAQITAAQITTGIALNGNISSTGTITAGTGLTVTSGGATVTAGDLTMTAGNVVLAANNISQTSGHFIQTTGYINQTGSGAYIKQDDATAYIESSAFQCTSSSGKIKTGNGTKTLQVATSSGTNLRGIVVGPAVGSSEEALQLLSGWINGGTGAVTSGTGFTCVRNTTGNYTITYTDVYQNAPGIGLTATNGSPLAVFLSGSPTTAHFQVLTTNLSGAAVDADVFFVCAGRRSV